MRWLVLAALCVISPFLTSTSTAARFDVGAISQQAEDVSLIRLIADPMHWHGKSIRVMGVLCLEFEGNGLYLSKDDYKNGVTKNAIWINLDWEVLGLKENDPKSIEQVKVLKGLIGKYVFLEGTFDGKLFGHMGLFSGEIHVTRIGTH